MNNQVVIAILIAVLVSLYTINLVKIFTEDDMQFMLRVAGAIIAPLGMILGVII